MISTEIGSTTSFSSPQSCCLHACYIIHVCIFLTCEVCVLSTASTTLNKDKMSNLSRPVPRNDGGGRLLKATTMVPMMLHFEPTSSGIMHTESGENHKNRFIHWNVEWRDLKSLLNFALRANVD